MFGRSQLNILFLAKKKKKKRKHTHTYTVYKLEFCVNLKFFFFFGNKYKAKKKYCLEMFVYCINAVYIWDKIISQTIEARQIFTCGTHLKKIAIV